MTFHQAFMVDLCPIQHLVNQERHYFAMATTPLTMATRKRIDCAACYLASMLMAAHLTTMSTLIIGKIIYAVMPFVATALVRRRPRYTSPHVHPTHTCETTENYATAPLAA
jgi:hypothetical protein